MLQMWEMSRHKQYGESRETIVRHGKNRAPFAGVEKVDKLLPGAGKGERLSPCAGKIKKLLPGAGKVDRLLPGAGKVEN